MKMATSLEVPGVWDGVAGGSLGVFDKFLD